MEQHSTGEGADDGDPGVFVCVNPLELTGFVYRDIPVHCHTDDDVHGARHEGVDHGDHEVGLVECRGVAAVLETFRNIK